MSLSFSGWVPWEKLSRATSRPARTNSRNTGSVLHEGPKVATILARRVCSVPEGLLGCNTVKLILPPYCLRGNGDGLQHAQFYAHSTNRASRSVDRLDANPRIGVNFNHLRDLAPERRFRTRKVAALSGQLAGLEAPARPFGIQGKQGWCISAISAEVRWGSANAIRSSAHKSDRTAYRHRCADIAPFSSTVSHYYISCFYYPIVVPFSDLSIKLIHSGNSPSDLWPGCKIPNQVWRTRPRVKLRRSIAALVESHYFD